MHLDSESVKELAIAWLGGSMSEKAKLALRSLWMSEWEKRLVKAAQSELAKAEQLRKRDCKQS